MTNLCFFPVSDGIPPGFVRSSPFEAKRAFLNGHVDRNLDYKDCVLADGPVWQHRSIPSEAKRLESDAC